jgi:3-hydroxyacyl-[acyl-carrier-protein] dehydratase
VSDVVPSVAAAAPLAGFDAVLRLAPDGIATSLLVRGDEPVFAGHYDGFPIFPGVFILEVVHQAARRHATEYGGPAELAEIRSARFLAPVLPGDRLTTDCTVSGGTEACEVRARCTTARGVVAEVLLRYRRTGASP